MKICPHCKAINGDYEYCVACKENLNTQDPVDIFRDMFGIDLDRKEDNDT